MRSGLVIYAAKGLSQAITIAIRYSVVRRQGESTPGSVFSSQLFYTLANHSMNDCKLFQYTFNKLSKPLQAFMQLTHPYSCILLHTLAYSCILMHTLAYSCILLHTLAYSCILIILMHTLAYSYILFHTLAHLQCTRDASPGLPDTTIQALPPPGIGLCSHASGDLHDAAVLPVQGSDSRGKLGGFA